jgi:ferritin-like metal-binding protein YciE
MADLTARDTVLVKYLNEAYGKEKQLETILQAQIGRTDNMPIKKRLREHLKETKAHARSVQSRIKAIGGKADAGTLSAVTGLATKATAAAKGPVDTIRGSGAADSALRDIRDGFHSEAEEIAHYTVIEAIADKLGDKETARLAKQIRREEERMQAFLGRQLSTLAGAVIREEVPARERKPAGSRPARRRSTARKTTAASKPAASKTTRRRTTTTKRSSANGRTTSSRSRGRTRSS